MFGGAEASVARRAWALERPTWLVAVLASAAGAIALEAWNPHVRDLAAHVFRAELFEQEGFSIWNGAWYGGHYLLTHSVLFPPLASLAGTQLLAVISVVASAYLFDRLVRDRWGDAAAPATLWFALAAVTMLASGRLSFALGVALGLGSLRALQTGRRALAAALAVACALGSPVAAVFLAGVLGVGAAFERRRSRDWTPFAVAAAALTPVLLLNLTFSEASHEPFAFTAWVALPLWCAAALVVTRGAGERPLQAVALAYLVAGTLLWLFPNPLGGNATRLGALFGGPVVAAALLSRRERIGPLALLLVAGSLWWQLQGPVRDIAQSLGDASTKAGYYEPLATWLRENGGYDTRVEVPFTFNHWETAHLAPEFQIARGWLRQVDRARNPLFYEGRLSHARYAAWLRHNGVRYVALSNANGDYSAEIERKLVAQAPPYLRLRAKLAHWRIYEVRRSGAIAEPLDGARGRVLELAPNSFSLHVRRPGRFLVRLRANPFWSLTTGQGCVGEAGDWTLVRANRPGVLRAVVDFSPSSAARAALGRSRRC
jgi:hypothetical protein